MTAERMKINFHVDVTKVNFYPYARGTSMYSDTNKNGYYITKSGDDYDVVEEKTNSVCRFTHDLSDLEK